MIIVERNSDGAIVMVAECESPFTPPEDYTVHNLPGWDWSKANLDAVDRTQPDWATKQLFWNGTTLAKKP